MTEDPSAAEKSKIAREILHYLADHPDAEDTLDGIVQWWLLERKIYQHTAAVQEALHSLAEQNYIQVKSRSGDDPSYRLNDMRKDEIRSDLLRGKKPDEDQFLRKKDENDFSHHP